MQDHSRKNGTEPPHEAADQKLAEHRRLVDALVQSLAAAPGAGEPERIETHISTVILHGDYAFKIKKPVDFGFLDFSSLEKRRHFCQEEIRLNGRFAPQLYLDVVPITGSLEAPRIDGDGEPVEFAVRMRRFPQEMLMSRLAEAGELPVETMDAVADAVVDFHASAARASADSEFSTPQAASRPVLENFEELRPLIDEPDLLSQLGRLEQWSRTSCEDLRERLSDRGKTGWVRECHGDMHLGNIALIDRQVVLFDGIEFNARMRWTDVLGDVGFLAMDLDDRGLTAHGSRFLSACFERSGDYPAVHLLDFYRVYRAMVRAKVNALRLEQARSGDERSAILEEYRSYTDLAERYTRARRPVLCITHGLSGCGKTTVAGKAVEAFGMFRIRSDVERKRLHGLTATERSGAGIDEGIYGREATRATYERLAGLADTVLRAGHSVVIDAAFLKSWQRRRFADLAAGLDVPFAILDIDVPVATLRERLARRQALNTDASDAGADVLEQQLVTREPLSDDELAQGHVVYTQEQDLETALRALLR